MAAAASRTVARTLPRHVPLVLSIQCSIVLYMRHGPSNGAGRRGRSRDPGIDARLLAAAYRHLSVNGFEALSLTGVAREAGTTRQALYRRWPDKASLAAAALAAAADLVLAV